MKNLMLGLVLVSLPLLVHAQQPMTVEDAWVRAAPPGAAVLGGYMKLTNNTRRPISLLEVSSPQFERVEMHLSSMVDGVARMEAVDRITVRGRNSVSLEPGGLHLMLFTPAAPVVEGDILELTLRFDNGWSTELTVPVRRTNPAQHQHH